MSYPKYRVKLSPSDDAHVQYLNLVKMLTPDEAKALRKMIKDQVGKTVCIVGTYEEYEIFESFPNIDGIGIFFQGMKSNWISYQTYYHAKYGGEKKTEAKPTTSSTTTTTTKYNCSPAMATCDGLYYPPL